MAKNLLEQFLDFATSKLTGPIGDDIYRKEEVEVNSGLTGVARYLAKQEHAAQVAVALTGVARYLARQAQAAETAKPAEAVSAPMSRVARYLANQEAAQPAAAAVQAPAAQAPAAPLSRVDKYLASQEAATPSEVAVQQTAAPQSRVAKYLASQQAAPAPAAAATVTEAPLATAQETLEQASGAPLSRVAKYLAAIGKEFKPEAAAPAESAPRAETAAPQGASTRVSKYLESQAKSVADAIGSAPVTQQIMELGAVAAPAEATEVVAEEPSVGAADIIRLDDGKQCQASTGKGTQCKNKSNLGHIQWVVNDQKYQFSVCTQHNSESFKPFAELLES